MDRVTNISWRTTSGATLGGFAYEYDTLGRITSRSHTLGTNAFDRVYTYDDFDRLATDGDVAYTYDAAGNRMTRTENDETITYTLGVGDRLASYGRAASTMPPHSGAYTHDTAGNVTRIERDGRPTLDLVWNSQYQLVSVSTNGVFAEGYSYDALGRRATTMTLEGTTRHVYDNNWQVVADIDEQGNVVASYTWGEGIDKLLAVTVGGATYYALTDIQGTIWGYVDSQNNVVARWQYDAWGNVVDEYVLPSAVALSRLRYRFQGREWSAATGLVNFRMRWYDAETGRWLSKDPIGLSGGLNLYAFCGDDAVDFIDPLGTSGLLLGLRPGPSLIMENGPKIIPRPLPAPKPEPIPRLSPGLKNWRPGRPIPDGFEPPPNPKGNWYNPDTGESLFDDMGHPDPIGPHFDLTDGLGHHFRWFPDGRFVPKIPNLPPVPTKATPQPSKDEPGGDAVTKELLA